MAQPVDPHEALRDALRGATPPASTRALDDAVVAELAEAIQTARRDQVRQLAASRDTSLEVVPRVLRGPVKKVLGL